MSVCPFCLYLNTVIINPWRNSFVKSTLVIKSNLQCRVSSHIPYDKTFCTPSNLFRKYVKILLQMEDDRIQMRKRVAPLYIQAVQEKMFFFHIPLQPTHFQEMIKFSTHNSHLLQPVHFLTTNDRLYLAEDGWQNIEII